jgi:hypothetical protein
MDFIMNATIGQLIGGGFGFIFFFSLFVEFTPIKWNPISDFLKWVGQRTNKGLNDRLEVLEDKMEEISDRQEKNEEKMLEQEAINCRIRILRFSDEIRRGVRHSQESFDQTLSDITKYKKYCNDHPDFENEKTVVASERIKKAYDKCMDDNDFL